MIAVGEKAFVVVVVEQADGPVGVELGIVLPQPWPDLMPLDLLGVGVDHEHEIVGAKRKHQIPGVEIGETIRHR